jgi:chorismate lyase/3-hydroxybenzoate synthase
MPQPQDSSDACGAEALIMRQQRRMTIVANEPEAMQSQTAGVLATVRYGGRLGAGEEGLTLPMPPAGEAWGEVWRSAGPVTRGARDGVFYAHDSEMLFGAIVVEEEEIETAARSAYEAIIRVTRATGFPFLARVWNHVRDLNAGAGDGERYRRFSAGRHEALVAAGFSKHDFPAASAVGMREGSLAVHFIASSQRPRNVENPRQVSAYDYPRQYGPRSPSFARATIAHDGTVFLSGTSSVVGHETLHAGDLARQAEETVVNLERISAECERALDEAAIVRLYVRHAADAHEARGRIGSAIGDAPLLVLESDICRGELLLEAEAVFVTHRSRIVPSFERSSTRGPGRM